MDLVRARLSRRWLPAVLMLAVMGTLPSCAAAKPSLSALWAEPVLHPLDGEVVLLTQHSSPRRARLGVAGRDGAVERIVALGAEPAHVADELLRRYDERYHFRRTDLGAGTPNTVELRGQAPAGPVVIATASRGRAVPLFASLAAVQAAPPDHPTSLVLTVISRQ